MKKLEDLQEFMQNCKKLLLFLKESQSFLTARQVSK